jgi:spermidine synthase
MRLSDTRLAALFLVSLSVLSMEIEVMRVFAVGSWSNFGSMVISIALLGFGVAGTLLTIVSDSVRKNPDPWLVFSAMALAPSMAVAHSVAQLVPFNPVLITNDPAQLWWIAAYYALYGIPFLAGGLFIGTMFATFSSRMHTLYFWNMLGSGLGGLLVLAAMFLFPPDFLIYPLVGIAILPALLCCVHWDSMKESFKVAAADAVLCLALALVSFGILARFGAVSVSDFKPESGARKFPDISRVYRTYSPLGEMTVYSSSYFHFAPGLSDNASSSLKHMPRNAFLGMFVDGNGPVGVMKKLSREEEAYMDFLPMSAPYLLYSKPDVLILRLGGGAGVHTALHSAARSVEVVESNPDLLHMLTAVPFFRAYTGDVLRDPRVHVTREEVRAYAGSTKKRFDIAEIGLVDSVGLSQAGGYSVEENYLYTVQAIQDYMKCLSHSGVLSITVWDRLSPPRNVPRLLSSVVEALRASGVDHPENRVFAFNLLLSTATVLVKNSDFRQPEIDLLKDYCRRMSFAPDYYPGMTPDTGSFDALLGAYRGLYADEPAGAAQTAQQRPTMRADILYHDALSWLFEGRQKELYSKYIFDIRPATDEKPYYSGYLKATTLPLFIAHAGDISDEWGYLLLLGTFLQSLIFGALIIILPLATRRRELFAGRKGTGGILLYFGCLGLGYMMAEIFLIQRFVYFLTDPVYTNSIILTILLISSGAGSLLAEKMSRHRRVAVVLVAAGIAAFIAFYLFGLSPVLNATLGQPLLLKVLLACLLVAPFGVLLGMPFPTGLSALSESRQSILPWAWGVNGALSVTGSVLTRLISTSAGFPTVLVIVAVLYVVAGVIYASNETREGGASPETRAPSGLYEKMVALRRSSGHSS